jgi:hypothetical protein
MTKFFFASSFTLAASFFFLIQYKNRNKKFAKLSKDSGENITVDLPSAMKDNDKNICWCSQKTVITCGQCRKKMY